MARRMASHGEPWRAGLGLRASLGSGTRPLTLEYGPFTSLMSLRPTGLRLPAQVTVGWCYFEEKPVLRLRGEKDRRDTTPGGAISLNLRQHFRLLLTAASYPECGS